MKRLVEDAASHRFSRELSWMAFNDRVLEEAADIENPLLERLKFLTIVSTNLEEFFMVRVAQLLRIRDLESRRDYLRDGFTVVRLLEKIRAWAQETKDRQAKLFVEIGDGLAKSGLIIETGASTLAEEVFRTKVLPSLAPVRIPDGDSLPHIQGRRLYLLARHGASFSLIPLPTDLPRVIIVKTKHVFLVDRLISLYRHELFNSRSVDEMISFKASRDAEIALDEEAEDLLKDVEEALEDRNRSPVVRLEVDSVEMNQTVRWLQSQLKLPEDRLYQVNLPLDLKALLAVSSIKRFKKLRYPVVEPIRPKGLPRDVSSTKFFRILDRNDVLLHHPFCSFDPVVELVRHASTDPKVTRICQTLYRTSKGSPILEALRVAARNGKRVTVLVEIKARFDEANNIRWARELERAGAFVVFGTPDIKAHAKLTYVERKVGSQVKRYVHVSTGNYHPLTAKVYTDLGLITTHPADTADAKTLFDEMEAMEAAADYSKLSEENTFNQKFQSWVVAPNRLHEQIISWIDREAACAREGQLSGIRAKMNGLVEANVIEALYRASQAGVKIELFVRGICCLRPGVPGLSENIRVFSLVDRYLEHSRFFIFENAGNREAYLSSADWMPRNFFRRIELAVPIRNRRIVSFLVDSLWQRYIEDNSRVRVCDSSGIYHRVPRDLGAQVIRAQQFFEGFDVPVFPRPDLEQVKSSPSSSRVIP